MEKSNLVDNEILRSVHCHLLCAITRNYSSVSVYKRKHLNNPKIMHYVCLPLQGKEEFFSSVNIK